MPHAFARPRRLAPIAVLFLLAMQVGAAPVRAATFSVDVDTKDTMVHVGDTVHYKFVVFPGDVRADGVVVSGSLCDSNPVYGSGDTNGDNWLDPGEAFIYTCAHVVDERGATITNTATANATPDDGGFDYSASDTVDVGVLHPAISLEVDVNGGYILVGDTVRYSFVVVNAGDTPLRDVALTSASCLSPMSGVTGDDGDDGEISADGMETWVFTCSGPTVGPTDTTFHAEAQVFAADALGWVVNDTDTADATVVHPSMTFVSTTTTTKASPGDTITFKYRLTNTGDTHLSTITVNYTACDEGTLLYGDDGVHSGLEPGDVWNGSCTHKVTEPIGSTVRNVFTMSIWGGDLGLEGSAEASVVIAAATASPSPTPTPRPSRAGATSTPAPAAPSASPMETSAPSASPGATLAATAVPVVTSAPVATAIPVATEAPAAPVADEGGGIAGLLLLLGAIVVIVAGAGFALWRRRAAGGGTGGPI